MEVSSRDGEQTGLVVENSPIGYFCFICHEAQEIACIVFLFLFKFGINTIPEIHEGTFI